MDTVLTVALAAEDAADPLHAAADRAARDKDRVVLTRDGKKVAALVPIEDLETLEAAEDAEDAAAAARILAEWEAAGRPRGTPLKEIAAELGITLSAGRAARDEDRALLTRDGKPVAALVPIEDLEALEAAEDAEDEAVAARRLADWEAAGRPMGRSHEELLARYGIGFDEA